MATAPLCFKFTKRALVHRQAIFLDRDGTLIRPTALGREPSLIALAPGSDWLSVLSQRYAFVVTATEPRMEKGHFSTAEIRRYTQRLYDLLLEYGIPISAFYICPHGPSTICGCRKPLSGLLDLALSDLALSPSDSWAVGDTLDDVEAANRAGCRSVLLDVGNESNWNFAGARVPHMTCTSFRQVVDLITRPEESSFYTVSNEEVLGLDSGAYLVGR